MTIKGTKMTTRRRYCSAGKNQRADGENVKNLAILFDKLFLCANILA